VRNVVDHGRVVVAVWFFYSYILFSMMGLTVTMLPFEALGQDLAQSKESRLRLFSAKGVASYLASALSVLLTLVLSVVFPTSIVKQVDVQGYVAQCMLAAAFVPFVMVVRENKTSRDVFSGVRDASKGGLMFMQDLTTVASNRPFWEYISCKVLLLVAFHLYNAMSLYYFKYVLRAENSVKQNSMLNMVAMFSVALYLKLVRGMMERVTARVLYRNVASIFTVCHALFTLLPTFTAANYVYVLMPLYMPPLAAATQLLPNHLLALTLDYHKLVRGGDNLSIYVMLDNNVVQMLDILVGSLPAIVLGRVGFVNNGGCSCGCGIACPTFHRWKCPHDAGFACSGALMSDNMPFYGEPARTPPCLLQPESVTRAINVIFFYVPVGCALVASVILSRMSMSDQAAENLKLQLELRMAGKPSYDPVRNVAISTADDVDNSNAVLRLEAHFIRACCSKPENQERFELQSSQSVFIINRPRVEKGLRMWAAKAARA